nr:acetyl-CoA carboxylase biotin carboxyl carrier protein subunit [Pseudomonas sp.]
MAESSITSEVTGKVWKILAAAGSRVEQGDTVLIVESMKMEIPVEAHAAGIVDQILVNEGDDIAEGQKVVFLQLDTAV